MGNTLTKPRLYSPSQIGMILRIARERSCQEERRTKRYVSEALGITIQRLSNIEAGYSECPFDLAIQWCEVVEDYTALAQIKHIYGMGLPATDPRLLDFVHNQLVNFIDQAEQAVVAARELLHKSPDIRPGDNPREKFGIDLLNHAEQILDAKQASECVLESMKINWDLDIEKVYQNWIQEGIADRVIIPSVSKFEDIRKEMFYQNHRRGGSNYEN